MLADAIRSAPALWLMVGIVATVLARLIEHWTPIAFRFWVRVGVYVVIPYLGLLTGGLSPRLLGISYVDWPAGLSVGIGFVLGVLLLAVLIRAFVELTAPQLPVDERESVERSPATMPWEQIGQLLMNTGAEEFHRAFLRGALWEALLIAAFAPDVARYWGTWIAAGIIVLLAALRRRNFAQWLVFLSILLATSTLYFYTRNFWLCWALHASLLPALAPLANRSRTHLLAPKG
jgi:hypothetical protein